MWLLNCEVALTNFTYLGKTEFDPDEDAHVVGDCVKVLLRTT